MTKMILIRKHKRYFHILAYALMFLIGSGLRAQQDSVEVAVLARPIQDSIMLRWSPVKPSSWKTGNDQGYHITRFTMTRNGERLDQPEETLLTTVPIKPLALAEWEVFAKQNENAAILAQAIYGKSFNTTTPGSDVGTVMTLNDENEQRFTFALLAAEQSFRAAKMAGLGYTDTSASKNETYLYRIRMADDSPDTLKITLEGAVLTGYPFQEKLPLPFGATIAPGDREIVLEWNYALLKRFYSRYVIERSENGKDFTRLKGKPIFNAQTLGQDQNETLVYRDSVPNDKTFHYRILGQTAFDQTGPPTKTLNGSAEQAPKFAPVIERKIFEDPNGIRILWSFDEAGEDAITGFELRRSNSDQGTFEPVGGTLSPQTRETTFSPLKPTNYFKVVALGKNGDERPSFPTLVQPVDSIPPNPPTELTGTIDTTGVIRLSWKANTEPDLLGYRVFRSNNPNSEFSQVTSIEIKENNFIDSLELKTLNKKIYYKILAEDQRYNASALSEIFSLNLPDKVPPSPPVLNKYKVVDNGIELNWIPSSSDNIASHIIYRKDKKQGTEWQKIFESAGANDSTFLDTDDLTRDSYSYTIIAKDSVGQESDPSSPLTIFWNGKTMEEDNIKFTGTVNRELRFINLSWQVKGYEVVEYRLYRGTDTEKLKLYRTLEGSTKGYNDVDLEINSNYTYGIQMLLDGGRTSSIKKIEVKY